NSTDCNDSSASVRPGASEACDGLDNNCNGSTDEGVMPTWYRDADGDGYGHSGQATASCTAPGGYVSNASDCDDSRSNVSPGGTEVCDGLDNNCSGSVDEGVKPTFYRDADGDGYGNANVPLAACSQPAAYVTNTSDCNDSNANIRPGAAEVCDSVDNNCNGSADEGVGPTWYRDADGDGYGSNQAVQACSQPAGYVGNRSDCADYSAETNPDSDEICYDGSDNNCNGRTDEYMCVCPNWLRTSRTSSLNDQTAVPPDCY
ncbi:putative metal-binding motif-containing protein, partial [Pyxidicoccus sp. 3LG]